MLPHPHPTHTSATSLTTYRHPHVHQGKDSTELFCQCSLPSSIAHPPDAGRMHHHVQIRSLLGWLPHQISIGDSSRIVLCRCTVQVADLPVMLCRSVTDFCVHHCKRPIVVTH